MKKLITSLLLTLTSIPVYASDLYNFDPNHTNIIWQANHFGFSNVSGKFTNISGKIFLDEKSPQTSSVELVIKADSINTGIDKFDSHLKSPDFFDSAQYPDILFKSTSVSLTNKDRATVIGVLTLKDISKTISLNVKLNKIGENPISKKKTAGFSISTQINRSEFGMKYALPGVSDVVKINIEAEAIYNAPADDVKENKNQWNVNYNKSKLSFSVNQNSTDIKGRLKKYDAKIIFNKNDLANSSIDVDIDMTSIDTALSEVLEKIKSVNWLAVDKFAKASFKSNKIIALSGENNYVAKGMLTIKNKTFPSELRFNVDIEKDGKKAKATGSATISRKLFEVGDKTDGNKVSDIVDIYFEIDAEKPLI